jgi:hypothetical protein
MTCTNDRSGYHVRPWKCPECGRFCSDSWLADGSSPNGWNEYYGGVCGKCGEWSDAAA